MDARDIIMQAAADADARDGLAWLPMVEPDAELRFDDFTPKGWHEEERTRADLAAAGLL